MKNLEIALVFATVVWAVVRTLKPALPKTFDLPITNPAKLGKQFFTFVFKTKN